MVLAKKILSWFKPMPVTVPETPHKPDIIDNISKWYVKGLIEGCFYQDYQSIGKGTTDELKAAFDHLIAQYHDQVKNEYVKQYVKLSGQIKSIETQWEIVNIIADIVKEHYSESAAKALKQLYPTYEFSRKTIMDDLGKVGKGEIANQIKHERLCKDLAKLSETQEKSNNYTPEQRHAHFLNRLAEINKHEGVKYDVHTTTVLELAVLENRLTDYIEHLEAQKDKHGRAD